jgi:membrane-associated phospholipid phosphatase
VQRRCPRNLRFPPIVFIVSLLIFGALSAAVEAGASVPGDRATYRLLGRCRDVYLFASLADIFASRVIEIAGAAATGAVALTFVARRRIGAAAFMVYALVTPALTPALKDVFDRPPPQTSLAGDSSFPSGHAAWSMGIAAATVILGWSGRNRAPLVVGAGVFVAAVGIAAVIAGNHWPSDVIAGWSLAIAWVAVLYSAAARRLHASRFGPPPFSGD